MVDLHRPARIRAAIRRAEAYAEERKVPLTAERLAAELGLDGEGYRRLIDPAFTPPDGECAAALEAIRAANTRALASVLEHALTKGSGVHMHLMYLKQYAGYTDAAAPAPTDGPVRFFGESELPE
ncbi:MAG: hypothetical protein ACOYJY_00180 [Acutalibacteraceae bacterium]|jgi:hypothetical protein